MAILKSLSKLTAAATLGLALISPQVASAQDHTTVRVGIIKIMNHVPIYVAKKLGFFGEEKLNVEEVFVRSGAEGQAAVIGGSIQFVGVNSASFIFGSAQEVPIIAVADGGHAPRTAPAPYAALINADSGISSPKDLEGKTIGVGSRKGLQEMHLAMWARKHDVDISKMKLIEVGYSQMQDALVSKQIDVALALEPFITRATEDPRLKLFSYFSVEAEPGHAATLWVGSESWINENADATKGFVKALYRAHEYMNTHPEESIKLASEFTGLEEATIKKSAADILPTSFDATSLIRQTGFMGELGWVPESLDITKTVWSEK